jgi:hypothetical protein
MADKLPSTQSLTLSFANGELPNADKLSALARQNKTGATIFENAIGDLWNQSNDSILSSYPLHIPNIARILGDSAYLNPAIFPTEYTFYWTDYGDTLKWDNLSGSIYRSYTSYPGLVSITEEHPIATEYTIVNPVPGASANSSWTNQVAREDEVITIGDYFIDGPTGKIVMYDNSGSDRAKASITTPVDFSKWLIGTEILPSIIPDQRQLLFTSCRISKTGSTFYLHLPPRQLLVFVNPSDVTTTDSPNRPPKYPSQLDLNPQTHPPFITLDVHAIGLNQASDIINPLVFLQDPTAPALAHEHYRYRLPKEIRDTFDSLAAGTTLPNGYMYLWNKNTNTIMDDVVFKKPTNESITDSWILEISSITFDFNTITTNDETEASYSSSGLILITPGASISAHIANLYKLILGHRHDRTIGDMCADLPWTLLDMLPTSGV